jgi:predicted nucleic acid-binding protein
MYVLSVDDNVWAAGMLDPPGLRTLDALHLASAASLGPELAGLVTYDERMAEAAATAGISVISPR